LHEFPKIGAGMALVGGMTVTPEAGLSGISAERLTSGLLHVGYAISLCTHIRLDFER